MTCLATMLIPPLPAPGKVQWPTHGSSHSEYFIKKRWTCPLLHPPNPVLAPTPLAVQTPEFHPIEFKRHLLFIISIIFRCSSSNSGLISTLDCFCCLSIEFMKSNLDFVQQRVTLHSLSSRLKEASKAHATAELLTTSTTTSIRQTESKVVQCHDLYIWQKGGGG